MPTLVQLLQDRASAAPDALAFEFRDLAGRVVERRTWSQLLARTRSIAARLSKGEALRAGDRLLLCYPPGLEIVDAVLACASAGLIAVPVALPRVAGDARATRLLAIHSDCGATAVLSNERGRGVLEKSQLGALRLVTTTTLADSGDEWIERPADTLLLQYTSGSSGRPRGVIVSHANVVANALATLDHVPVGVSWLPQHHDMGLIGFYLFPIVVGGRTFGFSPNDFLRRPALWLKTISEVSATFTAAPNFGWEHCCRQAGRSGEPIDGLNLSTLRVCLNGSEPVSPETMREFVRLFAPFGLKSEACVAAYGLAENTLTVTGGGRRSLHASMPTGGEVLVGKIGAALPSVELASCGAPAPGVGLEICDRRDGAALGERQVGEICVFGASVAAGYWGQQAKTATTFDGTLGERRLRTGDLGFLHEGELYVCGRIKDVLIAGGVKVHAADVEAEVERRVAAIRWRGSCAFQLDDGRIVIVCEAADGPTVRAEEVASAAQHACGFPPDLVAVVRRGVAKTSSGKKARGDTRAAYLAGELEVLDEYVAEAAAARHPHGSWHALVRAALSRHLALDGDMAIGDRGLDSLSVMELQLEIEELVRRAGAGRVAEALDSPLLQRLTPGELLEGLALVGRASPGEVARTAAWFDAARTRLDRLELEQLVADSRAEVRPIPMCARTRTGADATILLTGATGFFGPYLLAELLRQTTSRIRVLVRAPTKETALARVTAAVRRAQPSSLRDDDAWRNRVEPLCADLAAPRWGLTETQWQMLRASSTEIVHNGALVNYVMTYDAMKAANVDGTLGAVQLAAQAGCKLSLISSTFIFGWTTTGMLLEQDGNDNAAELDFGYAQSKWAAEQIARRARENGVDVQIFRPSLISVTTNGQGDANDVALRMLAFMIRHGIAVETVNQISITAADVIAHNIVGISRQRRSPWPQLHVTADAYYSLQDITRVIERDYGYGFVYYDIPAFIDELNRRCAFDDPVYPLLDFFNRSANKIARMKLKRYGSGDYREARRAFGGARPDPTLDETVSYIMAYLLREGRIPVPSRVA